MYFINILLASSFCGCDPITNMEVGINYYFCRHVSILLWNALLLYSLVKCQLLLYSTRAPKYAKHSKTYVASAIFGDFFITAGQEYRAPFVSSTCCFEKFSMQVTGLVSDMIVLKLYCCLYCTSSSFLSGLLSGTHLTDLSYVLQIPSSSGFLKGIPSHFSYSI